MAINIGNGLNLGGQRIVNLGDPSNPTDAATKQYADNLIRGLDWKASVKVATSGQQALTGLPMIDGYQTVAGDRVLVKANTTASENGIYVVASGAWSRASDFDGANGDVTASAAVTIEQGTTYADTVWMLTTDGPVTVGTTALTFSQLGGGQSATAGNGITVTGTQVAVKAATGGGILVAAAGVSVDRSLVPNKYAVNVPSGSTSAVITHGLNTTDVTVAVYDISGASPVLVFTDVTITSATQVTLTFATAPTSGQYRVVVTG